MKSCNACCFSPLFTLGCLQVVPGTHKLPLFSHFQGGVFVSAINDTNFNPRNAVDIEVPAGGASFHHVRTAHASRPNNSSRSRRVCFTQYCAADSWPLIGVVGRVWCRRAGRLGTILFHDCSQHADSVSS